MSLMRLVMTIKEFRLLRSLGRVTIRREWR